MPLFLVSRTSVALSTTNDLLTIAAPANRPLRLYIVDIKGMGNSSAANEVLLTRSTGGTTPVNSGGTAATVTKMNPNQGAATFSVYTGWTVQPTLTDFLWRFGVNANGGQDKFIALPGMEIPVPVGTQVSLRGTNGASSNVVLNILIDELDA